MENVTYLTKEAMEELKEKLAKLKSDGREDIANKIKEARAYGDISENSEYDAAREEEVILEQEIAQIELTLKNAKIITKAKGDAGVVHVGSVVVVKDLDFNMEMTFTITGSYNNDPVRGLVSNESPIGKALIGRKKGDKLTVITPDPNTDMNIEILSVKN
jgi:transcription elongation factor GreA